MFYRVRADLAFTEPDEGYDFFQDCQIALSKANVINPGQPNEKRGSIMIERCYHDQDPVLPCEVIDQQEVSE